MLSWNVRYTRTGSFRTPPSGKLEKGDGEWISPMGVETHPGLSHPSQKGEVTGMINTSHLLLFTCLFPSLFCDFLRGSVILPWSKEPEVDKCRLGGKPSLSMSVPLDLSHPTWWIWPVHPEEWKHLRPKSRFPVEKHAVGLWTYSVLRLLRFILSSLLEVGTKAPANDKVTGCIFWAYICLGNLMNKGGIWEFGQSRHSSQISSLMSHP